VKHRENANTCGSCESCEATEQLALYSMWHDLSYGVLLYKSSRNVLGPRGACSSVGKNISDDNRYEHGAVRSNAGLLICAGSEPHPLTQSVKRWGERRDRPTKSVTC